MVIEPKGPRIFRVAYYLDDVEVLTIGAPVTDIMSEQLRDLHPDNGGMLDLMNTVFHAEAEGINQRATFVRWFGRIERKEPR